MVYLLGQKNVRLRLMLLPQIFPTPPPGDRALHASSVLERPNFLALHRSVMPYGMGVPLR